VGKGLDTFSHSVRELEKRKHPLASALDPKKGLYKAENMAKITSGKYWCFRGERGAI